MCRWITILASDELSLSDVVLAPANSLVQMSKDASFHPGYSDVNNHAMNGDGFGVGWYHSNVAVCPTPDGNPTISSEVVNGGNDGKKITKAAVFKDTQPAWNHTNLRELCLATRSNCIMAHVRAASKNTGVSTANCHPFKAGRLLFCHNGRVDSFIKVRRAMMNLLSDEAFVHVRGTTDSECVFALILTYLGDNVEASPITQTEPFGHKRLVGAIKKAFRTIEILVEEAGLNEGEHFSTLNFSLTDGDTVVVTRFCDRAPEVPPPSLYFAYGTTQRLYKELVSEDPGLYISQHSSDFDASGDSGAESGGESDTYDEKAVDLRQHESRPGRVYSDVDPAMASFIVASNPLTKTSTWHKMAVNSIMWCTRGSLPEMRLLRTRSRTASWFSPVE